MKSYLKLSLILLSLLTSTCFDNKDISSLQSESFIKYFNNYSVFMAVDVKQVNGQGYALLGTVENSAGVTQICLIRTDEYGNTVDSARYYGKELNAKAHCLQVLPDGGFAILGSGKNQVTNNLEVYFIRTNDIGDTVWTKKIGGAGDVVASHFEVNAQGSFIMTGYAEKSDVESQKQIWIGAIDENGTSLYWSPKKPPSDKDAEGRDLQILDDGSFVITGITKNDPSDPTHSHAFILKATATGGAPGIYYLPATADEEGNCVRVIDDETFLVTGTVKSSATGNDIMLKKVSVINFELSTEWERIFENDGNDYGQCLLTGDNSIYILGTTSTAGINTAISLITTDSEGNNPRYSIFGLSSQLTGSSFERTSDNGFIISGTNKLSDNSISATLIKTRTDGSL